MPTIELTTKINAPIDICFDLARSIDLHKTSMKATNEIAVAGKTSGLIGLGEEVTWQATHLGIRQRLTSKITIYERPYVFRDEMVKGLFKSLVHDHLFKQEADTTIMKDVFVYESPLLWIGQFANKCFLDSYLRNLLLKRNLCIKQVAENNSK